MRASSIALVAIYLVNAVYSREKVYSITEASLEECLPEHRGECDEPSKLRKRDEGECPIDRQNECDEPVLIKKRSLDIYPLAIGTGDQQNSHERGIRFLVPRQNVVNSNEIGTTVVSFSTQTSETLPNTTKDVGLTTLTTEAVITLTAAVISGVGATTTEQAVIGVGVPTTTVVNTATLVSTQTNTVSVPVTQLTNSISLVTDINASAASFEGATFNKFMGLSIFVFSLIIFI